MYTQCPGCRESFRVTAEVLQQAAGRVRCGGCGHAFNALERLSETAPDGSNRSGKRSLVEDFDALSATDNVRIEDTGVEWQVLEEVEPANPDPQEPLDLAPPEESAEERYDDNTPLPEVFDDEEAPRESEPPRRRAEDVLEPRSPEFDERQVDLALSEPEDWTDLLAEVGDEGTPAATGRGDEEQADEDTRSGLEVLDADLEATGEHPALEFTDADGELTLADDHEPGLEIDDEPVVLADADDTADDEPAPDAARATVENGVAHTADEPAFAGASGVSGHHIPPPTEEEMTINRLIDQDLLRLAEEQPDLAATSSGLRSADAPPHVETIIMEGAFVRNSLEANEAENGQAAAAGSEEAAEDILDLRDTYVRTREHARRRRHAAGGARYVTAAGVAALALLLCAQVVHAYRETLATYGAIGESLISLYEAAGAPITPEWDVDGWQFLDTRSGTDAADRVLTISTTLANASGQALPYPLLHVALTDRYEEIIASQLLQAGQYLEIRAADGRISPGARLKASVTIAPLSPRAEGFKLNVCYPLSAAEVRCATGAFADR